MYVLDYHEEDKVMSKVNSYHYSLHRRVEYREERIVNESDEVEYCVQLWVYDNSHDFKSSNDMNIIISDMGELGLDFIKDYSIAWTDDIVRVLCFRKKNSLIE